MPEVLKIGVIGGGGWLGGAIVDSILRAGLAMNLLPSTAQGRSDIISMTRQDVPAWRRREPSLTWRLRTESE